MASTLSLTMAAAESVRRGHPWVWDKGLADGAARFAAGEEVMLVGPDKKPLARGLYEPDSPLAVRVWSLDPRAPIDAAHITAKLARAIERRLPLSGGGTTTAYRFVHGEGDRVPGLVIDRYGAIAIIKLDGAAAEALATRHRAAIVDTLRNAGVVEIAVRRAEKGAAPSFEQWAGEAIPATVVAFEDGIPFVVDLRHGQKTGAFLDQRDNRARVGGMARGKRVLNLFSYAGGFSLHAARGGAAHVTSVDIAAQAHGTAQASFRAAGLDPRQHDFVSADVFAFLTRARERGQTWDLVISDPPSFAPNAKSLPRAVAAYRALHQAAVQVLADGGTLCASSCSSHVDADAFMTTLDDVALTPRRLSLLALHGPPLDHPTLPAWPEGRYLKFAVLA